MALPDCDSPKYVFVTAIGKSIGPVGGCELLVLIADGSGYGFRKPLRLYRKGF